MTILQVLYWLLALGSPAAADPGTIGLLIVGAEVGSTAIATVGTATLTVAQVVGFTALTAASIALSYGANALLAKNAPDAAQTGQFVTRQPTPSRRRHYGRNKVGGATIFSEVADVSGIYSVIRVIAINQGEIDGFETFWLDDNQVVLSGGTFGQVLGAYADGATPQMVIDSRRGVATETAYGLLLTAFPTIWAADYRGDGIASLMVVAGQPADFENFTKVYPGGTAPNPRVIARFVKVWDPRDGGQDKDDPSTWEWTQNPVLIALDFHRHADGLGLSVFDVTLFTAAAIDEWKAAADICDETVGGVTRYACGGGYSIAEDAPSDVLAAILAPCDGQTYQRADGAIGIRVGKTVAPTVTIESVHITGYSELKRGDEVMLACNEVTAKYVSPAHDYQLVDAQPWRDEADITARGQVLTKAIALNWVQNHSQARRLMKLAHARGNPNWKGTIVTDMAGLAAINERYIRVIITEAELELVDEDFEVLSFNATMSERGITCAIAIASLDQSAFDWNEGTEAGTPPVVPSDE